MKYTITVPVNLMQELDTYAQGNNYNRSEAIREAIRRLCSSKEVAKPGQPVDDIYVVRDLSKKAQSRGLQS